MIVINDRTKMFILGFFLGFAWGVVFTALAL